MKINRSVILAFILLVLASSLYRVWPDRPFGFAPMWAMAIFAGAITRKTSHAFALPLVSMFVSDALYQLLYLRGLTPISGFYAGQVTNYILFASLVVFGLMIRRISWTRIFAASLAAPSAFFLISNFLVWISGGGYQRPTLMQAYADGIPFYQNSLLATPVFSMFLFGIFFLVTQRSLMPVRATA